MSHARRARLVLAAMACTAAAASAGCRSPLHRFPDLAPTAAPGEAAAANDQPKPPEPTPAAALAPTPAPEEAAAAPVATPMLDAALRRAEIAEHARAEDLRKALEPPAIPAVELEPPPPEPAPAPEAPKIDPNLHPAAAPVAIEPPATFPVAASADAPEPAPSLPVAAPEAPTPPAPTTRPEPVPTPPPSPEPSVAAAEAEVEVEVEVEVEGSEAEPADGEPGLAIDEARLCRKIIEFGRHEPLKDGLLHPGRSALVYCELSGLEYRPEGDEVVARVATRVQLIRRDDGQKVWEVADGAVDRRPTPRRDVYVGTLITLPDTIAPGEYDLRLHQADAASGRSATTELVVTVAR